MKSNLTHGGHISGLGWNSYSCCRWSQTFGLFRYLLLGILEGFWVKFKGPSHLGLSGTGEGRPRSRSCKKTELLETYPACHRNTSCSGREHRSTGYTSLVAERLVQQSQGANLETKEASWVFPWNYRRADFSFGSWKSGSLPWDSEGYNHLRRCSWGTNSSLCKVHVRMCHLSFCACRTLRNGDKCRQRYLRHQIT